MSNFYVITGGPGAGKTTLIAALQRAGYPCVEEGARRIIQEQIGKGGDALPWNNIKKFKQLLLIHAWETYCRALQAKTQVTFFDRSIFDLIAYERRTKGELSFELQEIVSKVCYNKRVFITPPWEEIFCNDEARKQSFIEAIEVYHSIVEVYTEEGFELIELPKASVEKRIDFIVQRLD